MHCTLLEKWMLLQAIVLADSEQEAPECPAYLFSETQDNEASVLCRGQQLADEGIAERLIIIDDVNNNNAGYPGAPKWIDRLLSLGVHRSDITSIPIEDGLNTYSESVALIEYALDQGWKTLGIVAPPFHQLRAFLSVVGAIMKVREKIRVYNFAGDNLRWSQTARHSQGTLVRPRKLLVIEEMRKIEIYTKKGDLATIDQALKYLDWRDHLPSYGL